MQAPVDYPLNDAAHTAEFSIDELAYAVMLDRANPHEKSADPDITAADHNFQSTPVMAGQMTNANLRSVSKPLAAIA